MVRFVDIDGTICRTDGTDYQNSMPWDVTIEVVNAWYDTGDVIVYWTARGMGDKNTPEQKAEIEALTSGQLRDWGCKFHELRLDKPVFDVLYDDRTRRSV